MRILVGWDDPEQADLISMYLSVDENQVVIATASDALLAEVAKPIPWDIILMTTRLPDIEGGYGTFEQIRRRRPEVPIVGACDMEHVFHMARFLSAGMRSYIPRDKNGDYVFLLAMTIDNVVAAVRAEREQKVVERLREEVDSVRKLQESIIPRDLSVAEGYQICARYEPSQVNVVGGKPVVMAGGDYYDVFSLDESTVVVLVGDASGHGMKACMSIMTMHTLVRMLRSQEYKDPASFMEAVNRCLCEQSIVQSEGGFITLLYGVLKTDKNELHWCAAGHPVPMIHNLEKDTIEPLGSDEASGMPLAIYPEAEYQSCVSKIPPGSRVLMYTDGLIEAFTDQDDHHVEFGIPGVVDVLKAHRDKPLNDAFQSLFDKSNAFTQGAGRHDDTSVVLLERLS
jgi:phosphoserine phosphatase RsbU/P